MLTPFGRGWRSRVSCRVEILWVSDKSGFRNAESRQRYLAVYERVRSLSPAPDVVHDVQTEFGVVRVYLHGPDGGVPLVLLHCFLG
jgi:hypothetical protein